MAKPFMIRFPLHGKDCYANVYTHETHIREFHVQIIGPEAHDGLPSRIILLAVNGRLLLSEPLDLSHAVLQSVIDGIEKSL